MKQVASDCELSLLLIRKSQVTLDHKLKLKSYSKSDGDQFVDADNIGGQVICIVVSRLCTYHYTVL